MPPPTEFENDVKEYGIQTLFLIVILTGLFENDVKEYGIQTEAVVFLIADLFENDVKEYGIQTQAQEIAAKTSLRMM